MDQRAKRGPLCLFAALTPSGFRLDFATRRAKIPRRVACRARRAERECGREDQIESLLNFDFRHHTSRSKEPTSVQFSGLLWVVGFGSLETQLATRRTSGLSQPIGVWSFSLFL
jgi:hypothetical protein